MGANRENRLNRLNRLNRPDTLWLACAAIALAGTAHARQGAAISETGLLGRSDIVFFSDFEGRNWASGFSSGTRRALSKGELVSSENDPKVVFAGRQSAKSFHPKGKHGGGASTIYLREGHDELYFRLYWRPDENWSLAPANQLKGIWFWGHRPGNEYPSSAGIRPTGSDKFSCHIAVDRKLRFHFYVYHMDQRGRYGDNVTFRQNGGAKVTPGKWHCIELYVRANDVGQKNGELKGWINGELKGHLKDLRFREVEDLKIRRASVTMYTGGAGQINTSPKDQYSFYDNLVIAKNYIGPAVFKRPKRKKAKSKRIVINPPKRVDPLAVHGDVIATVRALAKKGDYDAAAKKLPLGDDPALAAFSDGIRSGATLKKQIIDGSKSKRPSIYIDFGGRTTRAKLVSASSAGITARMMGSEMPIKWSQLSPARFYGIAARFSPDTPAGHLALARYCAAMGLKEKAKAEIQKCGGEDTSALAALVR